MNMFQQSAETNFIIGGVNGQTWRLPHQLNSLFDIVFISIARAQPIRRMRMTAREHHEDCLPVVMQKYLL